jgi:hypothetical protein
MLNPSMKALESRPFGFFKNLGDIPCSKQLDAIGAPLLPDSTEFNVPSESEAEVNNAIDSSDECPHCGSRMILQAATDKPSWLRIMESHHRPAWYRALVGS